MRAVIMMLRAKTVGGAFGEFAPVQMQGRPDLAQRSGSRIDPRHAQPDIPSRSRPPTSNSEASAAGPKVPDPQKMPLLHQPFTGASSLVTLTL